MEAEGTRYLVVRVPTSGPPAVIAEPNDFETESEARARIGEIESLQLQAHHTWLDIVRYTGDRTTALERAGILY